MANNDELLQQIAVDLAAVKTDVALTKQAVMGNGVRGLNERMSDMETWRDTHPRLCPLADHVDATVDTPKERKVSGWSIFAAVIGAVGVLGSLAVAVLK